MSVFLWTLRPGLTWAACHGYIHQDKIVVLRQMPRAFQRQPINCHKFVLCWTDKFWPCCLRYRLVNAVLMVEESHAPCNGVKICCKQSTVFIWLEFTLRNYFGDPEFQFVITIMQPCDHRCLVPFSLRPGRCHHEFDSKGPIYVWHVLFLWQGCDLCCI